MTNKLEKSRKAARQTGFRVSPVAAGCAVLLISAIGAAHAQQAAGEGVVTGIRASIESAIATHSGLFIPIRLGTNSPNTSEK